MRGFSKETGSVDRYLKSCFIFFFYNLRSYITSFVRSSPFFVFVFFFFVCRVQTLVATHSRTCRSFQTGAAGDRLATRPHPSSTFVKKENIFTRQRRPSLAHVPESLSCEARTRPNEAFIQASDSCRNPRNEAAPSATTAVDSNVNTRPRARSAQTLPR